MENIKIPLMLQVVIFCMIIKLGYQQESDGSFFYYQQSEYPKDCQDIFTQCDSPDTIESGVFVIKPEGMTEPIEVYCDQTTNDGGWTVIQRRRDGTIDFARNVTQYRDGFGFLNQEFWFGNNNLAYLTNQRNYTLSITKTDSSDNIVTILFDFFRISDENSSFKLVKLGECSATSSSSCTPMQNLLNNVFASEKTGCNANDGGWWFADGCNSGANLNGIYDANTGPKSTVMKVRATA